jgi:hypothetical protein
MAGAWKHCAATSSEAYELRGLRASEVIRDQQGISQLMIS